MNEFISLNKLFKSKKIYWIKTNLTLRRWVERDIKTNNILQTKTIKSKGYATGLRYYIPIKNIDLFIQAFEEGTLFIKK